MSDRAAAIALVTVWPATKRLATPRALGAVETSRSTRGDRDAARITERNMTERVAPNTDPGRASRRSSPSAAFATSGTVVYRCLVNFDAYALTAVEIINAPLATTSDLDRFFGVRAHAPARISDRDLSAFLKARRRLRGVFEQGAAGRAEQAVAELNALLEAYPVRPRIAEHDAGVWHLHVAGRGGSVCADRLAGAVWGLAIWLCQHGSSRFGVCADERCGNVYLDTSSNCCRRFCSERCATRSHVAAHRARKRATLAPRGVGPPGA